MNSVAKRRFIRQLTDLVKAAAANRLPPLQHYERLGMFLPADVAQQRKLHAWTLRELYYDIPEPFRGEFVSLEELVNIGGTERKLEGVLSGIEALHLRLSTLARHAQISLEKAYKSNGLTVRQMHGMSAARYIKAALQLLKQDRVIMLAESRRYTAEGLVRMVLTCNGYGSNAMKLKIAQVADQIEALDISLTVPEARSRRRKLVQQ